MVTNTNDARAPTAPPDVPIEEDDHDGWGPVRVRRSSLPAPVSAENAAQDPTRIATPPQKANPLKG